MVDHELDFMEHVAELRRRLLRSLLALLLGMLLALPLVTPALNFLLKTAQDVELIALSPLNPVAIFFKIAFTLGLALASPYIIFQVYAFVKPGLYPHERRMVWLSLPAVFLLFFLGFAFALGVVVPLSLPVLRGFMPAQVTPTYTLEAYLNFVTSLMVWMGVLFQVPLLMMLLTSFGLIEPGRLRRWRRGMIFGAAVLAALITPTVDPVTMLLVTIPMVGLYELGIFLSWLVYRSRKA